MTLADRLKRAAELLPPGSTIGLDRDAILEALKDVADAKAPNAESESRLLTVDEVAQRLGVSRKLVYREAAGWPFTRRIGPARRALRFDADGLARWLSRQR